MFSQCGATVVVRVQDFEDSDVFCHYGQTVAFQSRCTVCLTYVYIFSTCVHYTVSILSSQKLQTGASPNLPKQGTRAVKVYNYYSQESPNINVKKPFIRTFSLLQAN